MEEKRTIFDYLAQMLTIFGFNTLILNIFCLIFGDSAQSLSSMFALGNRGIPVGICLQFLCVSFLITGARYLFFTDTFIKTMAIWLRTLCILASIIAIIAICAVAFDWCSTYMWQPWAMFLLCFGLSFAGSYLVMVIKEKTENRRMEEALQRLKEKGELTK